MLDFLQLRVGRSVETLLPENRYKQHERYLNRFDQSGPPFGMAFCTLYSFANRGWREIDGQPSWRE